ncbi:MAG: hypothetical protein HN883_00225, partial [Euryarchaeota archaeon]|nr:hypothetical protein [Euryarchaeota archaeon]
LMVSGSDTPGTSHVPTSSFLILFALIASVLVLPMLAEPLIRRFVSGAPEFEQALIEQGKQYYEAE